MVNQGDTRAIQRLQKEALKEEIDDREREGSIRLFKWSAGVTTGGLVLPAVYTEVSYPYDSLVWIALACAVIPFLGLIYRMPQKALFTGYAIHVGERLGPGLAKLPRAYRYDRMYVSKWSQVLGYYVSTLEIASVASALTAVVTVAWAITS